METTFQELLAQQAEVEKTTEFSLSQVDFNDMGGLSNQFIVNGGNPSFVKYLIKYLEENQADIIEFVKLGVAKEVEEQKIIEVQKAKDYLASLES